MKPRGFFIRRLLEKVESARQTHALIQKGDCVVVALSGGPDSSALLLVLSMLRKKHNLRLAAAHLNHGLQGVRSQQFERRAEKTCALLEIPFYSKKVSIGSIAKKNGRGLEETGRIERYRFFSQVAKKVGACKIATAHTLDDQAETMLLRILRGSGLRGLSAIPFKRQDGHLTVIRPLLLCNKKELLAALKEARLAYVEDLSNRKDRFTRNRVRRRLLPFLEKSFNPRMKEALSGLQSACAEAQDFIERAASKEFKKCAGRSSNRLFLKITSLRKLHPAVRNEVLSQALTAVKGDLKRITHHHLKTLESFQVSSEANLKLCLPGVRVHKTKLSLDFYPK